MLQLALFEKEPGEGGRESTTAGGSFIPVTGVSKGMADFIFTKALRRLHRAASGLFIALVMQIPAVTAMMKAVEAPEHHASEWSAF